MDAASICFLGTGAINRRHIRIVRRLQPGARLSVASRDREKAGKFSISHGLDEAFGSYEEGIASSCSIVVVGVPPMLHHDLVGKCLASGKHIMIEKPVFNSMTEFNSLWNEIAGSEQTIMVAENLHFSPFQKVLARALDQEDMGRPLYMDVVKTGRSNPSGWRADPSQMPLGALHEGGVHWIRRLLGLASVFEEGGEPGVVGVRAYGAGAPTTDTPGEDTMLVLARHRSGLVSRLLHSWAIPRRFPLFDMSKVLMERGSLYFEARGIFGRLYGEKKRLIWPRVRDWGGYTAMWVEFLSAVREGRQPALTMETIFHDFAYMDAAYRSIESGVEEAPAQLPGPDA